VEPAALKNKALFLTISISILVLSALTGAQILPGPMILGVILAFLSIFVIPGTYLTLILSGPFPMTVESVCRIFFTGIFYATFMVSLGFIPGVGYGEISLGATSIAAVLVLYYHLHLVHDDRIKDKYLIDFFKEKEELSGREKRAMFGIVIVMAVLCFVFFDQCGELGVSTDAPDHISFIGRSISSDTILPSDSFYREGDGTGFDPRKGMWHPVLALWTFQACSTPDYLWSMVPSFFAFFALVTFWFYSKELLGSIRLALLASILFILFMRGNGVSWLTKIAYSKNISIVLLWATTGYIIRYMRLMAKRDLIISSLLVITGILFHLAFGYLMFGLLISLIIYAVILPAGRRWFDGFRIIAPVLTIITVVFFLARVSLVPELYNLIHTHKQGLLFLGDKFLAVDPVELLGKMGLVFFFISRKASFDESIQFMKDGFFSAGTVRKKSASLL